MADTARTLAALQTLFADNTTRDISAQNLRDFLVSTYQPQCFDGGRLTLESGVPVSSTDQTAKTSVKFTPYKHNLIGLYDGTSWKLYTFSETSVALGTLTADKNYDLFLYDNSGTLTLELLAWTNDSTRATALALQDGVFVKTGATTRRWVGTIRTVTTTTTEDSAAKRFVFSANNREERRLFRRETTASWTYSTATWRQANANTANQVAAVIGQAGVIVDLVLLGVNANGDSSDVPYFSIGADSITTPSSDIILGGYHSGGSDTHPFTLRETFVPAVGYHYWAWLEKALSTQEWSGGTWSNIGGTICA